MLDDQRCLATLEPRLDLSMLLLTLVTTTRCLSVSRRRTTTNSFLHMNSTGSVGETAEDRRIAGLEGEAGEVRGQRRYGSIAGCSAAQRRAKGGDSRRHRRRRGAVAVVSSLMMAISKSTVNFLEV
jgi:hypothetical protein